MSLRFRDARRCRSKRYVLSPRALVQLRLHRRIFAWFGVAIALTATVVAIAGALSHRGPWSRLDAPSMPSAAFVARELARDWDDVPQRARIAADAATDLGAGIELYDPAGASIASYGGRCRDERAARTPIERDGMVLGAMKICAPVRDRLSRRWLLPLGAALLVLWAASGALARHLVSRLSEVARVAEDIGAGRLSSRFRSNRRHGGDEVELVGRVINDMAARIERQLADQRALLATVSHEVRSPLSRMRLLLEFARGKAAAGAGLEEIDRIEHEVAEIDLLVSDLLANARLDFGAFRFTELDAVTIAKSAAERASFDPERVEANAPRILLEADATLLLRALMNLLENAARHAGGVDRLRIEDRGERVVFVVEDRGGGLPAGAEERVFEPFFQSQSPSASEGSTGLGLTLVRRIAEAHGGRAFAENRDDGGARVGIEIGRFARRDRASVRISSSEPDPRAVEPTIAVADRADQGTRA